MNSDTLIQLLQKSLRVTLGATATLIETLQDPQRRDENLSKLRTELSQLTEEWELKGETTEREARSFVDNILTRSSGFNNPPRSEATSTSTVSSPAPAPAVQQDLQELTEQIAAIRSELEKLREQNQ